MKKKILVVQPFSQEGLRLFEDRPDIRFEILTDFSLQNLLRHVADADALTVRDAPIPIEALEAAPHLKIVSRHGVGWDNIPVDYCTARGVPVTVVGDVNAISVAEHTMFLMLAAARHGVALDAAVRHGDFGLRARITGVELRGRRLLIVGFGRIGREVAARALAFGMHVAVFDPFTDPSPFAGVTVATTLEDGLAKSDVVSLHVPLTARTRNLIGGQQLALLPSGAIIINTARGGILDEVALVDALRSGHLRAVALDTFAVEPVPADHPILLESNTVFSPHSAALTEEALIAMGVATARNALAGLDGTLDPALVVNPIILNGRPHAAE
jgi:D-3-phosphoglycerate dehydrogenase / 2-oxoglutarate reductase